ncbi:MAG: hypothetical protein AAF212_05555 [Verrucomicrobiota bacterium]
MSDLKSHLSEYARRTKNGESFIICERNKPIAEFHPLSQRKAYAEYPEESDPSRVMEDTLDSETDTLLASALKYGDFRSEQEVIEKALGDFVRKHRQLQILELEGSVEFFEGDDNRKASQR